MALHPLFQSTLRPLAEREATGRELEAGRHRALVRMAIQTYSGADDLDQRALTDLDNLAAADPANTLLAIDELLVTAADDLARVTAYGKPDMIVDSRRRDLARLRGLRDRITAEREAEMRPHQIAAE